MREEEPMELAIKPYMWSGDGPRYTSPDEPGVRIVAFDVFDACGRMVGSIWRVHETEWRIARTWGGKWTGEYVSKDEALAALQAA